MTNPFPELEEEIVRMAVEAGFLPGDLELFPETIHRFAHLICQSQYIDIMALLRQALMIEREACAQLCDAEHKARLAQNIRARVNPIIDIKDEKLCTSDKCAYFSDTLPQEPIGYLCENAVGYKYFRWKKPNSAYRPIALYTAPPIKLDSATHSADSAETFGKREWVGLTDDEIKKIMQRWRNGYIDIKDVEQLLKEKNS